MTFADRTLRWQGWLLVAGTLGSVIIFLPAAVEPFMLPKVTWLVVCAIALLALAAVRAVWLRRIRVPTSPVAWAVTAFALALFVSTLTSATPWASVVGFYSRYTGLVPYLAYLVFFAVAVRVSDARLSRLLVRTLLIALGLVVVYGLLQTAGWEPVTHVDNGLATNFSLFGNVNFSSAWVGAVCVLCLPVLVSRDEPRSWRTYAAVLLPLSLVYAVLSKSVQGPVAASIGLTWAAVVLATAPAGRVRTLAAQHRAVAVGSAFAAVAVFSLALLVAWSRFRAEADASLLERRDLWRAGIRMFYEHPFLGTGLDTYAHHFTANRPESHVLLTGIAGSDAPHSVLLGMFSNGGLLLGVSYLAVVLLVGVALVRTTVAAQGATRTHLAGLGGVWLAYQAQSLVSFDVPPLAVLHWVVGGVIVSVAAPPRWRELSLPGRSAEPVPTKRGKPKAARVVPVSTRVALPVVVFAALGGAWLALYPLRADLVAASAEALTSSGQYGAAVERFERAANLNPSEASYSFLAARGYDAGGFPERAVVASEQAAARDPGTVQYALFAAREAEKLGDREKAERWYRRAAEVDPAFPAVLAEVAHFLLEAQEPADAETLLERAAALQPGSANLLLLARSRLDQRDKQGARAALERVLLLEPSNVDATSMLASLD